MKSNPKYHSKCSDCGSAADYGSPSKSLKKRMLDLLGLFRKTRVLVVGDFILDQFIWGKVERISPEAPVPVVHVQRESYMTGGSLNVANNIRTLGGTVYPCGVVGRDREGRMLVKIIRREGINTGGIVYDADRPTSLKTRIIAHSQQLVRFDREKLDDISDADQKKIFQFIRQNIASVDVVIIEDYGKGVIRPEFLQDVIRLAKRFKKPVLVDPKDKHFSYYKGVTVITPNRKEAYTMYESGSPSRGLTLDQVGKGLLKRLQSEAVLITVGEDGMMLFERNGSVTHIPTAAREVYDVSGAGDTVIAVLAMALAAGAKMLEASMIANLAAGIVVGKLGTATIQHAELEQAVLQCALNYKTSKSK
jgi:D-beta-D-heptose 7-phosphate kinase/D-beta-D-heptose 1-phosphate adenosyltransferase